MTAAAKHQVCCLKSGCRVTWPRDPVLEVACPICKAGVGARCRRPSGHRAWGGFHRERDILADQRGCYGVCPTDRCGLDAGARAAARQADMFKGAAA